MSQSSGRDRPGSDARRRHYRPKSQSSRPAERGHAGAEPTTAPSGLAARDLAVDLLEAVLVRGRALDDALDAAPDTHSATRMEPRDRGFARLIAATVLRNYGSLDAVLARFLDRPLPLRAARIRLILLACAAQILLLKTPAHAAINAAVSQCQTDGGVRGFDKLANAVLRKVAVEGGDILASLDRPQIDIPEWIWQRWVAAYSEATARQIAAASLTEAPLDLSVKSDAALWSERLGGDLLVTGTIRLATHGRIEDLPGYAEGAWWVQDAAAALPTRLLGNVDQRQIADLCAAPGGKTAALAAAGAHVTAVDSSAKRLRRLAENMARLGLAGQLETVVADVRPGSPGEPSTRCCSMRPAPPPGPSAAIRTFCT